MSSGTPPRHRGSTWRTVRDQARGLSQAEFSELLAALLGDTCTRERHSLRWDELRELACAQRDPEFWWLLRDLNSEARRRKTAAPGDPEFWWLLRDLNSEARRRKTAAPGDPLTACTGHPRFNPNFDTDQEAGIT